MSDIKLYCNPDLHPDSTSKKFNVFIQECHLRWEAHYPDPLKVLMDAEFKRWELTNWDQKSDMNQWDNIRKEWIQKEMITKFLGIFFVPRMFDNCCAVIPNEQDRKKATWQEFAEICKTAAQQKIWPWRAINSVPSHREQMKVWWLFVTKLKRRQSTKVETVHLR